MLRKLINRSKDIRLLISEGYEVEIRNSLLLIHNIPYVNADCNILYGTLVSNVSYNQNHVCRPNNHVIYFIGNYPCHKDGSRIHQIKHQEGHLNLGNGVIANFSFSNKPPHGYKDFYEKFTQYIKILSGPAESLDASVTAKTFRPIVVNETNAVLNYYDTNSSRADIDAINDKLLDHKVAIVGLGGTGSYVLEFLSKKQVSEIHIFDGDDFLQHNAFRSPGAASVNELQGLSKVDYLYKKYSVMHKNIIPHKYYINASNVGVLSEMDFVFICIDRGAIKKLIFEKLEEYDISFIDTGIGIERVEDSLLGTIRTTTSTKSNRSHVWHDRVSFSDDNDDDYASNIQIAELNALNAIFAIMKWKKILGFYVDQEKEVHSLFNISVNQLINDETRN